MKLIDWLTCKDVLLSLSFTEEEITKALEDVEYSINDLTDLKCFRGTPWVKDYELVREKVQFTTEEWNGEWKKEIKVIGNEYRIKAQYQGIKHGKLIFQLFKNRYDWFDTFTKDVVENIKPVIDRWTKVKDVPEEYRTMTIQELIELEPPKDIIVKKSLWNIYQIYNDKNPEMYLETEFGSLYVPYKAILNNDFKLIKNRMETYFKSYYNTPDRQEYYNKAIKALKSKEAKQLKKYLC